MKEKKFVLMPATQKDTLPDEENTILASVVDHYLEEFKVSNIGNPVNIADFSVFRYSGDSLIVHLIFETDPEDIPSNSFLIPYLHHVQD